MKKEIKDLVYSVLPKKSYLEIMGGNYPVIISTPHGGNTKPISFPNRTYGTRTKDSYTRTITKLLLNELTFRPYYIISDIHRSKVDLNREIVESAQGSPKAEAVWHEWDRTLKFWCTDALSFHKKALHIDIHSNDDFDKIQLGYGISARDYNVLHDGGFITAHTTVDSLGHDNHDMLFGWNSFFHIFESHGFPVDIPENDRQFYNGGRNIEVYSGKGVGAIQIEFPIAMLRKSRRELAKTLADGIHFFCDAFVR